MMSIQILLSDEGHDMIYAFPYCTDHATDGLVDAVGLLKPGWSLTIRPIKNDGSCAHRQDWDWNNQGELLL